MNNSVIDVAFIAAKVAAIKDEKGTHFLVAPHKRELYFCNSLLVYICSLISVYR